MCVPLDCGYSKKTLVIILAWIEIAVYGVLTGGSLFILLDALVSSKNDSFIDKQMNEIFYQNSVVCKCIGISVFSSQFQIGIALIIFLYSTAYLFAAVMLLQGAQERKYWKVRQWKLFTYVAITGWALLAFISLTCYIHVKLWPDDSPAEDAQFNHRLPLYFCLALSYILMMSFLSLSIVSVFLKDLEFEKSLSYRQYSNIRSTSKFPYSPAFP